MATASEVKTGLDAILAADYASVISLLKVIALNTTPSP